MAQRTEKEETEFKAVPETISLCINNCGVTASPTTNNMCQSCFNATTVSSSSKSRRSVIIRSSSSRNTADLFSDSGNDKVAKVEVGDRDVVVKREVNRCSGCRRKVGLTGFRCRCGDLFCAEHRYSDRHDCGFDYKAAGREAIFRENPVVKAAKIVRI